jgi:hypothetical protein
LDEAHGSKRSGVVVVREVSAFVCAKCGDA